MVGHDTSGRHVLGVKAFVVVTLITNASRVLFCCCCCVVVCFCFVVGFGFLPPPPPPTILHLCVCVCETNLIP